MPKLKATPNLVRVLFAAMAALMLCLALFGTGTSFAGESFSPTGNKPLSIDKHLDYLDDPKNDLTIGRILAGDHPGFQSLKTPNYGFGHPGTRWVKFVIDHTNEVDDDFFLLQKYTHVQNWAVYYPDAAGTYRKQSVSEDLPTSARPFRIHNLILRIPIAEKKQTVYYASFEPRGHALNIDMSWMPLKGTIEYIHDYELGAGLFFGGLGVLILYNALICLLLRSRIYLYYIYYLSFFTISFVYLTGLSPIFIDLTVRWEQFFAACAFLGIHGMTLFGRKILKLERAAKFTEKYLKLCEWCLLAGCIASFFMPVGLHYRILNVFILLTSGMLIIAGLRRAYQGYPPAKVYAVGWSLFIASMIVYVFMYLGFVPLNWLTMHAVQGASVLEAILFSIALAVRFKIGTETAAMAKNSFIAMVSHELKTPLQSIVGCLELVAGEGGRFPNQQTFQRLKAAAEQLEFQVKDLTDYARLESGKLALRKVDFKPHDVASEIISEYVGTVRSKGLRLEFESKLEGIDFCSDPIRFRQILTNLVENAIKYTDSGGVWVRLGVNEAETELAIEVEDTGIGIAADQTDSVFEPFTQVDQSSERRYEGIGMGLTIVRNLVGLLGGRIDMASKVGKGTSFVVTLPNFDPAAVTSRHGEHLPHRILLVDDNEDVLTILGASLKSLNYRFDAFSNGIEAVFSARLKQYDAVLLDINMPRFDGFEIAKRLRNLPGYKTTPIVWISATKPYIEEKAKSRLFTHFLEKPIHAENLGTLLRSLKV